MRKGRGSCVEPSSLKNFGSMFDAEAIHAQIPSNIEPNYQRTWCNGHKTGHASFLSSYIAILPLVSPMFVLGLEWTFSRPDRPARFLLARGCAPGNRPRGLGEPVARRPGGHGCAAKRDSARDEGVRLGASDLPCWAKDAAAWDLAPRVVPLRLCSSARAGPGSGKANYTRWPSPARARGSGKNALAPHCEARREAEWVLTHRPRHLRTVRSVVPMAAAICWLLCSGCVEAVRMIRVRITSAWGVLYARRSCSNCLASSAVKSMG